MSTAALILFLLASAVVPLRADPPAIAGVLEPKTAAEAWNVIRLATRNVERLLEEKRLPEIPVQISYCSPALRALPGFLADAEAIAHTEAETKRAFLSINAIASSAQRDNSLETKSALATLRAILDGVARHFDPRTVGADIFFCQMHSDFLSDNATAPCAKCGKRLVTRRIPYSFIYTPPGEPTIRMTATASAPVEAGKKIEVKVRMEKADKSPFTHDDLLVMQTQPIHLLIEEPGLGDYHHERPVPTKTPGEYAFSFTPAKTTPYRIWADIVPAATGVQELPFVDLPATGKGGPVADTDTRYTSTAGGYHFTLSLSGGTVAPVVTGHARRMAVTVKDSNGQPVKDLEPVMKAFAHLVGFYSDYETVLHLHPNGGDVLDEKMRGGPSLTFMFFPPKPGFIRLYCQVSIGGKMLFAPFNINVQP